MKPRRNALHMDKTTEAVSRQAAAMGCDVFEIGVFKPEAAHTQATMLPRTWDADSLMRSVAWLRRENRDGRSIYVRPKGTHNLSLVDDLTKDAVAAMKQAGFNPALVVETSPGNYQAWVKHADQLGTELSTAAARTLAAKFGGDTGAADWRHFGRLAGFTNRKPKYRDAVTGLHPFVRLIEANGTVYPEAERFIGEVKQKLEERIREREQLRQRLEATSPRARQRVKSIYSFRCDSRYRGDGNRVDLAYAIYAFSHGVSESEVAAAIRSRDLSHKGNEKRQHDYVARTLRKAANTVELSGQGR